ncbi:MAG: riboflavin synthase [Oligoflexia bacterium]|nr:riboflavin synthase [Oligoflexia bacterium]
MFSGIVEELAVIAAIELGREPVRLSVSSALDHTDTQIGDSVLIEGVCLTVVEKLGSILIFELSSETLRRTTLADLDQGERVHLERSLKVGTRINGHFVFGHADGCAELISRRDEGRSVRMEFKLPSEHRGLIVPKGSISLSGISLTVGEVSSDSFSVYVIPHTSTVTRLGTLKPGERVNLEIDMLARYVKSILASANPATAR